MAPLSVKTVIGQPSAPTAGVDVGAGGYVVAGVATGAVDGINSVVADIEGGGVAAEDAGDGDGVVAHEAAMNAKRRPMPADRCERFPLGGWTTTPGRISGSSPREKLSG